MITWVKIYWIGCITWGIIASVFFLYSSLINNDYIGLAILYVVVGGCCFAPLMGDDI